MASKKSPNDGKGSKAQLAALNKSKGVKPTAAVTKPGQKATGLAKSTVKDRFASTAKTPVKKATSGFAGSGMPLGASMGVNPLNKGQIAKAVLSAGAGAAASGYKIATKTVVSEATKKLQRELATLKRDQSMKKMTPAQRRSAGESFDEMDPVAKWEMRGERDMLQSDISKSMKSTNKTKRVIKRK